jgi:chromosome segregation ATPase
MIEPIMYVGLGFLVASLAALIILPFVHARAVRLTMRRLEAATPLSMAEIQADKDQLRAEFAMSTRRLEMSVDKLKTKTTSQLAELGKKTDTINRLKVELGEKTAAIFALEARDKALKDQLHATEEELSAKTGTLREVERVLSDKEAELARLSAELDDRSVLFDSQNIEVVSLRTQVDALKGQVMDLQKDVRDTEDRLARERIDAEAAAHELAEERGQVEKLGQRVAQLERQLAGQVAEAEILSRRLAELETRLAEQGRMLAERERERDQLRREIEAGRKIETDLRQELTGTDRRHGDAIEALKTEKSLVESQLDRAREDRAKLQRELAAMKREAEATWAAERVENALLRERINDVAAEVVRLTAVLEGSGSAIDAILAEESVRLQGNGAGKQQAASPGAEEGKGSLADRIRALQARASRVPSTT